MAWVAEVIDRTVEESSARLQLNVAYYDNAITLPNKYHRFVMIEPGMTQAEIAARVREKGDELHQADTLFQRIAPGTVLVL